VERAASDIMGIRLDLNREHSCSLEMRESGRYTDQQLRGRGFHDLI
jgi:hypothetical protein